MQVLVAFAVGALVVGYFHLGPRDPMQAVAAAVGLVLIAAGVQAVISTLRKGKLRERYRVALQTYGREFGETEFFNAVVAASGRGLESEGRMFQRPSGFDRDLDEHVADLTDRRRWSKEAEILYLVGELEESPSRFANGLYIVFIASLYMAYRFVTAPLPVTDILPPLPAEATAEASAETAPQIPDMVLPDRYGRMPDDYAKVDPTEGLAKMRYVLERCGAVRDTETGLRWFIGPDLTFQRDDAERYVRGLRQCDLKWRLPTLAELAAIHDPNQTAGVGYEREGAFYPAHLSPMFSNIGRGTWAWMEKSGNNNAFNLHVGHPVELLANPRDETVRVIAVSP